jgi:DNA-binding CsgD family transcriptional regulator
MRGFPANAYHPPRIYVYHYSGIAHLATLLLWREKGKSDISPATLAFMAEIEPFLVFMFSDLVARHQQANPGDRSFIDALAVMAQEAQLTEQERRAVILQLFGHSYQEIADRLHLSIDTVRKHVKNIYRKTGTGSYTELFAKYFTSRLGF